MADNAGGAAGDAAGEISLSIDETNKLRISLGLKPLKLDSEPGNAEKERQNHAAKKKEQEAEAQAAELRAKLQAAREKRQMEAKLKAVKTLGLADGEDEDMASWVEKNRRLVAQRKEEEARKKAEAEAAAAKKRKQRDDDDEEGAYKASELEGLKVKHDLGEVGEGETVIMTLADRSLLDERGNLVEGGEGDELENVLAAEEKRRRKALKAATKVAKPLWEEDGKVRTLLDKYDEEEEEAAVQLGAGGMLESERVRRAEEVRKKLAAGLAHVDSAAAGPGSAARNTSGDYYTPAEMAAFNKPKKKKSKGERRMRAKSVEKEEEGTADLLATLEAQAELAAAEGTERGGDLGKRSERGAARERAEAAEKAAAADKRDRFEAAVQKANWASQFLRPEDPKEAKAKAKAAAAAGAAGGGGSGVGAAALGVVGDDDEGDRELRESLERARRLAQKKREEEEAAKAKAKADADAAMGEGEEGAEAKPEAGSVAEVARLAAARRQQASGTGGGVGAVFANFEVKVEPGIKSEVITETMEFVRNIQAQPAAAAKQPGGAASVRPGTASTLNGGAASVRSSGGAGAQGAYDDGGSDMDEDGGDGQADRQRSRSREPGAAGGWVTAEDADMEEAGPSGAEGGGGGRQREGSADPERKKREGSVDDLGVAGERPVGKGLAGALGLLNELGALKQQVEWSGRNNDRSKVATIGLDEVYTGGRNESHVSRAVEAALTIRDQYGRVLTPKERFRNLCYDFHGIKPSKNQIDKRARKDKEEIAIKKAATSEDPSAELDRLRAVQRATGSAYVVISGKNAGLPAVAARADDSDDEGAAARRRKASAAKAGAPAGGPAHPTSGIRTAVGNLTPLLGDKKVEAMLGIRKPPKGGPGK